jgi:hypothetical protein
MPAPIFCSENVVKIEIGGRLVLRAARRRANKFHTWNGKMKKRARLPQKIIDEYKRIAENLLRKHADWDERIHRIHAAKLFVRNPYIQGHCC